MQSQSKPGRKRLVVNVSDIKIGRRGRQCSKRVKPSIHKHTYIEHDNTKASHIIAQLVHI